MTRDEAAQELANLRDRLIWCDDNKDETRRAKSALNAGIEAIVGKQPDAETGLVPCGCGGKAVMKHRLAKQQEAVWYVRCDKCDVATAECFWELAAKNDWNGAMGYADAVQEP